MSRPFTDWPEPGPIDLAQHDPPHASSSTEWWYVNAHVETADGRALSFFAAFFRIKKATKPGEKVEHAHSITWALSDPAAKQYWPVCLVDKSAPKMGLERIKQGRGTKDARLNRAMAEILERDVVPLPDRMFTSEPTVAEKRLELDFGGNTFVKQDDGTYRLHLANEHDHVGVDVVLTPRKPPIRHGDDGVVRGHAGEDMFYYFIPRCDVTGTITLQGTTTPIAKASGWYDHEFGAATPEQIREAEQTKKRPDDIAWNWVGLQLDDGSEVTAFSLVDAPTGAKRYDWAVLVGPKGERSLSHDLTMKPAKQWRSVRSFHDYPTSWTLEVPEAKLSLQIDAAFDDQEFVTVVSKPAFWEGRVSVRGTIAGRAVTGLGYLERSGFEPIRHLDDYFSAVGEEVRKSVANMMPLEPTREQTQTLIASKARAHYMDGVDTGQIGRALIAPIREITDRGGKSWRSYAALACCDVVRGDSRKFVQWLAMPELLHVGSLIVDDVQDRSTVRRGKPTVHVMYGDPIAINSGTAAYFLAQKMMFSDEMSAAKKLRLYDLYFEAMCAGHAGQAMDLDGPGDLMPAAIASGDSGPIERRILATHRLKTAAPAGALARMGAVAGGGTEAQIEAVGRFFEAVGLAFQLIDDVLNLRGFKGDLKSAGEDISNGTITLPVAKAMSRLATQAEREAIWRTVASKPKDRAVVADVIAKLEACGAIEACEKQARDMVEDAWKSASPLLDDSLTKIMLRAFGWYVLERHY
jgi:geranylgeranyl pyrophosphate synthase/predicted secreted hydrolase